MKKIFFGFLIVVYLSCFFGFSYAYQSQGFSQYIEKNGKINFSCKEQCLITLGNPQKIDYGNMQGEMRGYGTIGWGFLVGNQLSLINQKDINEIDTFEETLDLSDYKKYLAISDDIMFVILMNGNISGDTEIQLGKFSFLQKMKKIRNGFQKIETFTPYSINLRYGITFFGTSRIKILYIVFIVVSLGILIFGKGKKEQKIRLLFFVGLGMTMFVAIRNVITDTSILQQGLNGFYQEGKQYFDLGDYLDFTNNIRTTLKLDNNQIFKDDCKIYFQSYQEWPFVTHRENFYLKPCERVFTGAIADYRVYYKIQPTLYENQKILLEFNDSYLLENKTK